MEKIPAKNFDRAEEAEMEAARTKADAARPSGADEAKPAKDTDATPPGAKRLYAQPEDVLELHGNVIKPHLGKPAAKDTGARFDIKL